MSDFDSLSSSSGDKELQEFLMIEKQKAQVNAQVSWRPQLVSSCFFLLSLSHN